MRKIVALILAIVMGLLFFGCASKQASVENSPGVKFAVMVDNAVSDEYGSLVSDDGNGRNNITALNTPSALYHNGDKIMVTDISAYQTSIEDRYCLFLVITMDVSELSTEDALELYESIIYSDLNFAGKEGFDAEENPHEIWLDEDEQQLYLIHYNYKPKNTESFESQLCFPFIIFEQEEMFEAIDKKGETFNRKVLWRTEVKLKDKLPGPKKAPKPVKGYLEDIIEELS